MTITTSAPVGAPADLRTVAPAELPALPNVACTCVITAHDFDTPLRPHKVQFWTTGMMRYVIAALAGAPVAVTTDNGTGHTLVGARLVAAATSSGQIDSGPSVLIETNYGTGTHRTWYRLVNLGAIMPLAETGTTGAKWTATDAYRADIRRATDAAQRAHGPAEGRCYGKWSGYPSDGRAEHVCVSYEPYPNAPADSPAGTRWHGVYDLVTGQVTTTGY